MRRSLAEMLMLFLVIVIAALVAQFSFWSFVQEDAQERATRCRATIAIYKMAISEARTADQRIRAKLALRLTGCKEEP